MYNIANGRYIFYNVLTLSKRNKTILIQTIMTNVLIKFTKKRVILFFYPLLATSYFILTSLNFFIDYFLLLYSQNIHKNGDIPIFSSTNQYFRHNLPIPVVPF